MFPIYKFPTQTKSNADWDQKYACEAEPSRDAATYRAQPFVQTILRHIAPKARILDAGCGTGGLLWFFRQCGFEVTGIDTSHIAVETARRMVPRAVVDVASILALPFPDTSFDVYLAIGSWEYPEQGPRQAAREAARVLKPGGYAFIEVPQLSFLRRAAYVPLKRIERWRHTSAVCSEHGGSVSARFSHFLFTVSEMRRLLTEHGFETLQAQPHDLPEPTRHYGLWVDWPFLRGGEHYELNLIGRCIKAVGNAISPWTISTGVFIVVRKR